MRWPEFNKREKKALARKFRFGLEAEFLLAEKETFLPLWHKQLSFSKLNSVFESIPLEGIPSLEGLELEPPQAKLMPFVVEGYHLPDMDFSAREILPKGVEIRTPVCNSLDHCLETYSELHKRLENALAGEGYAMVALSHHPEESRFSGPQNKRRHDYWQWSMEVMTTYGPDINVSLAPEMAKLLDFEDLEAKINYYGPPLSALSVASPFCEGKPWEIRGRVGKSFRMHKRSYIAPPVEFHAEEKQRIEFKVFDMPCSLREFEAQFLVFLALLLDDGLKGRASKQSRIYDLGQVARLGIEAEDMGERAGELLSRAPGVLQDWGFDSGALEIFEKRLAEKRAPADDLLDLYASTGCLSDVLRERGRFCLAMNSGK